jgi:alkylation response protein AidB-like acyl-CoA dehydrogenase
VSTLHADFREAIRGWLRDSADRLERFRTPPVSLEALMAQARAFQRLLHDEGWLRWGWPENVGGLGGSAVLRGVVSEELTAAGYPPPFSFGVMEVLAPAVERFAAPSVAAEFLPRLFQGDDIWCQGFSEPDAGSDLASLRTRALRSGDDFLITGQKVWTSWAQYADRCVLLARTGSTEDGYRGITAFFVDMDTPGITVQPLRAMTGDSEFAELFLDDVRVPASRVIGEVGGGWAITMFVLACERGALAWQRAAWLLQRLGDLRDRAGDRAGDRLGVLYTHLYALRLAARRTLRALASGQPVGPEASVDKLLMSTAEQALFDAALDLLPESFTLDDDADSVRWRSDWCYSRASSIYGGTAEIQRNVVAERLLKLPKGA